MKSTAEQLDKLSPERRVLLQKMLAERSSAKRASQAPTDVPRRAGDGPVPLSFAQQRLWFIHQLDLRSPAYNMPVGLRLGGPLDPRALRRALGEIVRRHEALRTVFATAADGEPVQVVLPPGPGALPLVDLAGLAPERRERETGRLAEQEAVHPFDLERGPLLRSALLRLGEADHAVLFTMHHIVSDGWSLGVLVNEVSALYAAFAEGRPSPLPELPVQYADYTLWQREHVSGQRLDEQLEFWRRRLAGAPALLELPTDRPRPAVEDSAGAVLKARLSPELSAAVLALGRREGTTPFMTLLAGLQLLLSRWSGQDDVVVGSPIAGRTRVELEGLIGFFVNTLALRTELSDDPTPRELLARVRAGVLEAHSHQDLPFERLVEALQPERTLAHSPVFQVLLAFQNNETGLLELGAGLEMDLITSPQTTTKFDLNWTLEEIPEGIGGAVSYRSTLWDEATIGRMVDHFRAVLAGMAAHPHRPVSRIELLTGAEREQVVSAWNATDADYSARGGLSALFEAQAARTPGAVAVAFGAESLTYAELDRRSAALAARLHALGAGTDSRVGLYLERSLEMMVGVLGVVRAGAAYVPIDPAYPADRVAYMLADAGISVLLTQERLAGRLPEFGGEIVLVAAPSPPGPLSPASGRKGEHDDAANGNALSHSRTFALSHPPSPDALAYVIYTSGSTGRPKGVAMPQRPLLNLLAWQLRSWHGPAAARTLQFASISFDVSFQEIFSTWASGGTLLVVPEEVRADMARLARFLAEAGVERIFLPFIALQHLAEAAEAEGIVPAALREVVTAGEQLRVTEPVRRWLARMPGCVLVNQYGPSETHVATALALAGNPEAWPLLPGIGGPVANTRCYVLERGLGPAPVGVPGELFLGGDGVARGYLGRPELTAERFVPDPFGPRSGARLYRTGDRARWLAGGELEFLGRVDQQVKVRGFRIEPGEVEAALEAHPAVREAVVVARGDAPGDRRLAAYLVAAAGDAVPGAAELRAWLAARLPEYMVPAAFVALDRLPLTPSGKVHRGALPAPDGADLREAYVAPRTPTEERVAEVFAAVLRRERVGAHDGFFALGGHSLLATRVTSRVRDAWGVELPLLALFEAPTVAGVAERIDRLRGEDAPASAPIPRRGGGGPVPLSFAQQRLWFIDRMEPGSAAYNMPAGLRLGGGLDVRTLRRTLGEVVRRHESLRTVFGVRDGEPVQTVLPAGPVRLPVAELAGLAPDDRERELRRLAAEEAARPFDLARGPLLRSALLRLGEADHAVLFTMHHVVSDGWSIGVLVSEVSALYAAFAAGRPPPLPELPVQYPDYAVWQRARLTGDVLEAQLAFWRGRLAGAPPVLELPTDRPRPASPAGSGALVPLHVGAETADALRALARREGATLFMALLAGWQALLARYAGQDDVVVGSPIAGRTRAETEGLIGFFVNTLVLRADLSGSPSFRALLAQVRESTLGAFAHQDVPFEKLVEELAPGRSLAHSPLFQVLFTLQNNEQGELRLGGLEVEPLGTAADTVKFDLSLSVAEHGRGLAGSLSYRTELWERATAERMLEHLATLLGAAAADPDRPVGEIALLGPAERERILVEWSAPGAAAAGAPAVHLGFAEQARRTPGAPAVVAGGEALSYAELEARSNQLARLLLRAGVGPEVRVGIHLERSPELVVALLAVLKAGGAYVPLDPSYPPERLAWMLGDAGASVIVAREPLPAALAGHGARLVLLGPGGEESAAESTEPLAGEASPDGLAYVIYTSGSTGLPKGVAVPHRALASHMAWMQRAYPLAPDDRVLQKTPLSFDASVWEFWAPLLAGAALVMAAPGAHRDPAGLLRAVADEGITTLQVVPSLLRALLDDAEPAPGTLRRLFSGGEVLDAELAGRARARLAAEVVNLYGPTETCIDATSHRFGGAGAAAAVPIGRPVDGVRAYVLDRGGEPVPAGVAGELYLAGAQVARGYLGRPELTAEKFVPDPFAAEPGSRAYRSGDRARWLPGGVLEFLGRVDDQLKVRGFRIEPGEVEAALELHPGVARAAVAARGDAPGGPRLVGYVVPAAGAAPDAAELRMHLRGVLPEHMVPAVFAVLDALPLTPSGKTDRRALPAPDDPGPAAEPVAPRTVVEEILAEVWCDILKLERVGVYDDFFALGGHSLLATRVVARVRDETGEEVPLRVMFETPTVAGMAAYLEERLREDEAFAEGAGWTSPGPEDG